MTDSFILERIESLERTIERLDKIREDLAGQVAHQVDFRDKFANAVGITIEHPTEVEMIIAANMIRQQASVTQKLIDSEAEAQFRGDLALATLDSLVLAIAPVMAGEDEPSESEQEVAYSTFELVRNALAQSMDEGDNLDPTKAIARLRDVQGRLPQSEPST